jgi:hypothetical protein
MTQNWNPPSFHQCGTTLKIMVRVSTNQFMVVDPRAQGPPCLPELHPNYKLTVKSIIAEREARNYDNN